ncbi:hypothetical protein IWZ01DRAFT_485076 [Phyllosticta capitalensis]
MEQVPNHLITPARMGRIAREIFETTRDTELHFRKYIMSMISLNFQALRRNNCEISQVDGFWEVLGDFNPEAGNRYRTCPSCETILTRDMSDCYLELYCCDRCGDSHSLDAWNRKNSELDIDMASDTDTEDGSAAETSETKRGKDD